MKNLYIIRHAKSSWEDIGLSDFERPLNERGKRDSTRMAKRLKEREIHPSLMLSSPAKRALSTCKRIAEILQYPKNAIQTDQRLYHADEEELLAAVRRLDDNLTDVLLFAHNPGITDFVNQLNNDRKHLIMNVPTCGVAGFNLPIKSWKRVEFGCGELMFFDFPKSKDD